MNKLTSSDKRSVFIFTVFMLIVAVLTGLDIALKLITPWSLSCYLYCMIFQVLAIVVRDPRAKVVLYIDKILFGLICFVLIGFVYASAVIMLVRPVTVLILLFNRG